MSGPVWIIHNPHAGSRTVRRRARRLKAMLRAEGLEVAAYETRDPQAACDLVRRMPADTRALVAVGGDGTVANILASLRSKQVPLYIMPAGTENLLARCLGHSHNPRHIVRDLTAGRTRRIDIGLANGLEFGVMAGIGFDAEMLAHLGRGRHHVRKVHFALPVLAAAAEYDFPPIRVEVDGRCLCPDAGTVIVCNTRHYGVGLQVGKHAHPDDGMLDVVCYRDRCFRDLVIHAWHTWLRRHVGREGVTYVRCSRRVRLTSASRVRWQRDGDLGGVLPLTIEVLPSAVPVFLSASGEI